MYFRSRDKDGGHSIQSAIAENPMLYANITALSFIEPELLPTEVLYCRNRAFHNFEAVLLTRSPLYTTLTRISLRCIRRLRMNFVKAFESYRITYIHT